MMWEISPDLKILIVAQNRFLLCVERHLFDDFESQPSTKLTLKISSQASRIGQERTLI